MNERIIKLSYAAGLIDGEGCIGMYLNSHNGNYQLRLSVEMGEREGLDILDGLLPGKWYYRPPKNPKRETYTWMLFNSDAYLFLKELEPFMYVKKKHAQIIQEADWINFKGRPLTQNEKDTRKSIATRIKQFNERGYYGEGNESQRRSWNKEGSNELCISTSSDGDGPRNDGGGKEICSA
jgi:hypothetical protein